MKYFKLFSVLLLLDILIITGCDILNKEKKIKPIDETPVVDDEQDQYNTVQIGNQIWMKKNLNIGNMLANGQMPSNNNVIEKYCYNNDTAMCNIYGGLYSWDELMNYSIQEGSKGICPDGWHVPTLTDWQILINHLGGNSKAGGKLKEPGTEHWLSPNLILEGITEFSARPSGVYNNSTSNHSQDLGKNTYLWSSSGNTVFSWSILMQNSDTATIILSNPNISGLPVRCIKN